MNKDIKNVTDLLRKLDKLTQRIAPKMNKLTEAMKVELQTYPSPPPNSSYIRTGNLGRSWHKEQKYDKDNFKASIYTDGVEREGREYSVYVQKGERDGRPAQAWMHKGRWKTHTQVATANEDNVESIVLDELVRLLSG